MENLNLTFWLQACRGKNLKLFKPNNVGYLSFIKFIHKGNSKITIYQYW